MNTSRTDDALRMIQCVAGGQTFWLDTSEVSSVQQASVMNKPQSDDGSVGFIRMARINAPIYSLSQLLGIDNCTTGSHIVTLQTKRQLLGLLVDRVSRVYTISREHIVPLPRIATKNGKSYYRGVVLSGAGDNTESNAAAGECLGLVDRNNHSNMSLFLSAMNLVCDSAATDTDNFTPGSLPGSIGGEAKRRAGQLLLFSLDGETEESARLKFGVSISQVLEVSEPLPMIPVPTGPDQLEGLIDWRNIPVPIVNFGSYFGCEISDSTQSKRLLIMRFKDGQPIGFYVDASIKTDRLPMQHQPLRLPVELKQDFVEAFFQTKHGPTIIPNLSFSA